MHLDFVKNLIYLFLGRILASRGEALFVIIKVRNLVTRKIWWILKKYKPLSTRPGFVWVAEYLKLQVDQYLQQLFSKNSAILHQTYVKYTPKPSSRVYENLFQQFLSL